MCIYFTSKIALRRVRSKATTGLPQTNYGELSCAGSAKSNNCCKRNFCICLRGPRQTLDELQLHYFASPPHYECCAHQTKLNCNESFFPGQFKFKAEKNAEKNLGEKILFNFDTNGVVRH